MALESFVRARPRANVQAARPVVVSDDMDSPDKIARGAFTKKTWSAIVNKIHKTIANGRLWLFSGHDENGYYPTLDLRVVRMPTGEKVIEQCFRHSETKQGVWRSLPEVEFGAPVTVDAPQSFINRKVR